MRVITAVLSINDRLDPPTAGLTVEVDGRPPVLTSDDVPPADLVAAVRALGEAVGVDLMPLVSDKIAATVDRIEASVADGEARQSARERALADWQAATA